MTTKLRPLPPPIRIARLAAGLSQEALARRVDCSIAMVRLLELGYKPVNSRVLPRLLQVLNDSQPAKGMTIDEIERRQDELVPKDDLSPYVGQWVALRDGHVIASDLDAVALRDNLGVHEDDVLMPVPKVSARIV